MRASRAEWQARASLNQANAALKFVREDPLTLQAAIHLVSVLRINEMKPAEAQAVAIENYARCLDVLGEDHLWTINLRSGMRFLAWAWGVESLSMQREVLGRSERQYGREFSITLFAQPRLEDCLAEAGFPEEGTAVLEDAVERLLRLEGPHSRIYVFGMSWLARAYAKQGRFDDAETWRVRVVEGGRSLGIMCHGQPARINHRKALKISRSRYFPCGAASIISVK